MDIKIHSYSNNDKEKVYCLYRDLPTFFTPRALSIIIKDIENMYSFVAKDCDGNILGNLVVAKDFHGDRVYELKLLAIRKTTSGIQNIIIFKKLIKYAEQLFQEKARIFIIYTSGTSNEKRTRRLFELLGYTKCAVIPDFWDDGDDRVVFLKRNSHIKKANIAINSNS